MTRLPLEGFAPGVRLLDDRSSRYLARVKRLAKGAELVVFDPRALVEADAVILSVRGPTAVTIEIGEVRGVAAPPTRPVRLVQCVGKGQKLDAVVRDATELGVTDVQPALSARTVKESSEQNLVRLERIALDAARQCGRPDVPRITAPRPLEDVLRESVAALKLLFHPRGEARLAASLAALDEGAPIELVIGPEGGFTDEEVELAASLGYRLVRLGPWTLRTETAATAALGALLVTAR